jgi:hypothetical protein
MKEVVRRRKQNQMDSPTDEHNAFEAFVSAHDNISKSLSVSVCDVAKEEAAALKDCSGQEAEERSNQRE